MGGLVRAVTARAFLAGAEIRHLSCSATARAALSVARGDTCADAAPREPQCTPALGGGLPRPGGLSCRSSLCYVAE